MSFNKRANNKNNKASHTRPSKSTNTTTLVVNLVDYYLRRHEVPSGDCCKVNYLRTKRKRSKQLSETLEISITIGSTGVKVTKKLPFLKFESDDQT